MIKSLPPRKNLIWAFLALTVIFISLAFLFDRKIKQRVAQNITQKPGITVEEEEIEAPKTEAFLSLEVSDAVFGLDKPKMVELRVDFEDEIPGETLDYFKTEISFPKDYLAIPAGKYIDTSGSSLNKIFRVDGPVVANENGKIVVEIGADAPGGGPSTAESVTIAKIYFQGRVETLDDQVISFGKSQIVNNRSKELEIYTQDTVFTVSSD